MWTPDYPQQVTFWHRSNGVPVRVILEQDCFYRVSAGGPTDEGKSSYSEKFTLVGNKVLRVKETDGTDCEGRMTTRQVWECTIDRLKQGQKVWLSMGPGQSLEVTLPKWVPVEDTQRDFQAEADGY